MKLSHSELNVAGQSKLIVGLAVLFVCVSATPGWACFCTAFPSFDEAARKQGSVVLVGQVVSIGAAASGRLEPNDPTYVDLSVRPMEQGQVQTAPVRVWNIWAGSSCGGDLQSLPLGSDAAFVVETAAAARRRESELWDALGAKVPSSEFVLLGICGESVRRFRSSSEAVEYARRLVR